MPASPVLNDKRWNEEVEADPRWASAGAASLKVQQDMAFKGAPPVGSVKTMTLGGTLSAIAVLFTLLLVSAAFGWGQVTQTETTVETVSGTQTNITTNFPGWIWLPMIVAVILGFVTIFKPKLARFLAPLYALGYGIALGAISHMYNLQFNGIVLQAVGATLAVFFVMLFLYVTRIIKVTSRYVTVVIAATAGIFLLYFVTWIATLFGADIAFWNSPSLLGIGISVVIVIVAALNLGIDFRFIESAIDQGAPRYMEWYGAFGLTVTIIWLYLEVLRLLNLLNSR